jgi:hypothetical protein
MHTIALLTAGGVLFPLAIWGALWLAAKAGDRINEEPYEDDLP